MTIEIFYRFETYNESLFSSIWSLNMDNSTISKNTNPEIINFLKEIIYNQNEKFLSLEKRLDNLANQIIALNEELHQYISTQASKSVVPEIKKSDPILQQNYFPEEQLSINIPTAPKEALNSDETFIESQKRVVQEFQSENVKEEFASYRKKKSQVETKALKAYLTKLESVIIESWGEAKITFEQQHYLKFLDLGLTVLHGIIEYSYVTHFKAIPPNNVDYYSKAKNIASAGVFKDLNLLDKMESVFSDKKAGIRPVLAKTVIRGWYERLDRIFNDWNFKTQNSLI